MKTILLALLGAILLAQTSVNAQASRNRQSFDIEDDDDRPKKKYDDNEKDKWIYFDGKKDLDEDELKQRNEMWQIDLPTAKFRGAVTGLRRGFFKDFAYRLPDKCFGRDSVGYFYYLKHTFDHLSIEAIIDLFGLIFSIYHMFDQQCQIEEWLYIVSNWCFTHNCSPEQLLKNEMGAVF